MESTLNPNYQRIAKSSIRGGKTCYSTTFTPDSASPGEKIYVRVPKLDPGLCIIPNSMHLVFNFKNSNAKSWFLNNLSRLLVSQMQIKIGREVVYDNIGESTLALYRDKWLTEDTRLTMFEYGIANENTRKLMSGDDSGNTTSTTEGIKDKVISDSFKNFRLRLGKILNDHGLFAPNQLSFDVTYTITLPTSEQIMKARSSQTVRKYTLTNLRLEYETIRNDALAKDIFDSYNVGRTLSFEHASLETTTTWNKDATSVNENLHVTRRSIRAVVMLFRFADQKEDEDFIFRNIDEVHVSVNGVPNAIYSNGLRKEDIYREARKRFTTSEHISRLKFLKDRFALVLDFRTVADNDVFNTGVKVDGGSGIQVRIKRTATAKDVICKTYVLSDALIEITIADLQRLVL